MTPTNAPTIAEFFAPGFAVYEQTPHKGTTLAMIVASYYQALGKNVKIFNSYLHFERAEAYAVDAGLSGFCRRFQWEPYNTWKLPFGTDDHGRVEIEIRKDYPFHNPAQDITALCHRGNYGLVILDSNPSLTPDELKAIHDVVGADVLAINHTSKSSKRHESKTI
jgi:hypothetical protein